MLLPPGLARAIKDSTSPFGAYPSLQALRNLELYLADPRSTDAVYEGLISRAYAEPLSVPLVENVVALLKAYLHKHSPSQDIVQMLVEFSCQVLELPGLSPAGRKGVTYARWCLRQLGGERMGSGRHVRGSNNSLSTVSTGRSAEELPRLAVQGLTEDGRVSGMKVSGSGSALGGRVNERYAAADSLPSPTDVNLASGSRHLLTWLGQSDGSRHALGYPDLGVPLLGASTAEPPWAVPSRPLQLPPAPPGLSAAHARSWLRHLPDLAPRVTLGALAPDLAAVGLAPTHPPFTSLSGGAAINLANIHRSVLDLEEQDISRHIAEVLGEVRAEAQQQQPPAPSHPHQRPRAGAHAAAVRDGLGAKRGRPARLLFHHPPYNRAEPLIMMEADVSVVVEAVCGLQSAHALAAVAGPLLPDRDVAADADGHAEGMWQAAFEEDGEFGQICGGILVKLLVDMWMRSEPQEFFVIVLRLLTRALRSVQPTTRARAFDVLYNLNVHGAMLRTDMEEEVLAAAAAMSTCSAVGVPMPWQVCASAPISPLASCVGGIGVQTPPPATRTAVQPQHTTPGTSTAEPQTPAAAAPPDAVGSGRVGTGPNPPVSHSLGLQSSSLLDSVGELLGPQMASRGAPRVGGTEGIGKPHTRKDTPEVLRLPPVPASPATSPDSQTTTSTGAPTAAASGKGGTAAVRYDRWLRALLFRLLVELQQTLESSEEVWRAAMGCLAQMCSHGGYWVAAWVQHLPASALSCLLRAACNFDWSQELYAQLLMLVPCVLTPSDTADVATPPSLPHQPQPKSYPQAPSPGRRGMDSPFAAPSALKSAVAASADDAAAVAATHTAAELGAIRRRVADFGGIDELLFHFVRAPTPDARASLLTALVQCCCSDAPGGGVGVGGGTASAPGSASVSVAGSAEQLHLNHDGRSPQNSGSPGSQRALDGTGGASGSGSLYGSPAGVLAVLQALHMDSVCLSLRAAIQRPWQGMSSRLADVLASANLELGAAASGIHLPVSPSGSISGSAEHPLLAMHTLPPAMASPLAVRALLRPLLESLEACCAHSTASPQGGELRQHMDVSVAHIAGAVNTAAPGLPPVTSTTVAAAWRCFKEVCNDDNWQSRTWAVQWLHKLLSAACRTCQGQILLLSPLTLKTSPELSRMAAASAPSTTGGPHSTRTLWNTALADALLHVVREVPQGCELLMSAIIRTAADLKAAAAAGPGAADGGGAGTGSPPSPRPMVVPQGAVTPATGVSVEEAALGACRRVMWLYSVGLQWMLQCGSAAARMPTVVEVADAVLEALLQPDPAAAELQQQQRHLVFSTTNGPLATTTAIDKAQLPIYSGNSRGVSSVPTGSGLQHHSFAMPPASPSQQQPGGLVHLPHATGTASCALQKAGGGMLISQQFLVGLLAVDQDALACTPPELLVTLLQQCSQRLHEDGARAGSGATLANGDGQRERDGSSDIAAVAAHTGGEAGFRSKHRGFLGRPCWIEGVAAVPGALAGPSSGGMGEGDTVSGAAVGPWQDDWQDRRLALLLLLIARCSLDPESFAKYSLSHVIKAQLGCDDLRCRYYAGVYLLKHWVINQQDKYWRTLRHIIGTAQQLNDERLLDNPYLQMRAMLNVDHV